MAVRAVLGGRSSSEGRGWPAGDRLVALAHGLLSGLCGVFRPLDSGIVPEGVALCSDRGPRGWRWPTLPGSLAGTAGSPGAQDHLLCPAPQEGMASGRGVSSCPRTVHAAAAGVGVFLLPLRPALVLTPLLALCPSSPDPVQLAASCRAPDSTIFGGPGDPSQSGSIRPFPAQEGSGVVPAASKPSPGFSACSSRVCRSGADPAALVFPVPFHAPRAAAKPNTNGLSDSLAPLRPRDTHP